MNSIHSSAGYLFAERPPSAEEMLANPKHRKRVGLALGGGVVRGLAHIGVLAVLEEAGIQVDYLAGTSVGAIVAAAYAAGKNAAQLKEYAAWFRWRHVASPVWPVQGIVCFDKLEKWMIKELGDLGFKDLKIPCSVIATDLERGVPVTLDRGSVVTAVHASCCVPGFVRPVQRDGLLLADGAMSNVLPVSVLREMGADYVIGVDIFTFTVRRWLGSLGYFLAGLEILLEHSGGGIDQADCLIVPHLEGRTYLRFGKRQELYELGRQATYEKLDVIRGALGFTDHSS